MAPQDHPSSAGLEYTPVEDIQKIYQRLQQGHSSGHTKSQSWRIHQLKQLAYLLQENEPALEQALASDLGRPRLESQVGELVFTRKEVLNALDNVQSWMKPKRVQTDLAWSIARPTISHEPKGVVLILGAWNYPVALLIGPLVGAIAGGNSVLLKPSESCPATSSLLTRLIRAYLDPENVQLINGSVAQNNKILELKFDHIFFTGSEAIGRIVARKAAEQLTPVTLELGGKCPAIVFDDADFLVAARRITWAKVVNAGQTCIAPDFVIVSKQSEEKFVKAVKTILEEFYPASAGRTRDDQEAGKGGNSSESSPEESQFCKVISGRQFERLTTLLRDTKGSAMKLAPTSDAQPAVADAQSRRIPLTLVRNVDDEDVVMKEEIFGPILPVLTFDEVEQGEGPVEKLERACRGMKPLAIYAFGKSAKRLEHVRKNTKSGQFVCNDLLVQFAIPGLPFGGIGSSGIGNYHGYHSFQTFTYERPSLNVPIWADVLFKTRYPPYTAFKLRFFRAIMGPKRLGGKANPRPPMRGDQGLRGRIVRWSRAGGVKVALLVIILWVLSRRFKIGGKEISGEIEVVGKKVAELLKSIGTFLS